MNYPPHHHRDPQQQQQKHRAQQQHHPPNPVRVDKMRDLADLFDEDCPLEPSSPDKSNCDHGDHYDPPGTLHHHGYDPYSDTSNNDDHLEDYDDEDDDFDEEKYYGTNAGSSVSPTSCCDFDYMLSLELSDARGVVDVSNLVRAHERSGEPLQRRLSELQAAQKSLLARTSSGLSTVMESPFSLESLGSSGGDQFFDDDRDHEGGDSSQGEDSIHYPVEEVEEIPEPDAVDAVFFRKTRYQRSPQRSLQRSPSKPQSEPSSYGSRSGQQQQCRSSVSREEREEMKMRQMDRPYSSSTSKPGAQSVNSSHNSSRPSREDIKMRLLDQSMQQSKPGAQSVVSSGTSRNGKPSREDLKTRQLEGYRKGGEPTRSASDTMRLREMAALQLQHQNSSPTKPGAQSVSGNAPTREDLKAREIDAFRRQRANSQESNNSNAAPGTNKSSKPGAQAVSGRPTREDIKQREIQAFQEQRAAGKDKNKTSLTREQKEELKMREIDAYRQQRAQQQQQKEPSQLRQPPPRGLPTQEDIRGAPTGRPMAMTEELQPQGPPLRRLAAQRRSFESGDEPHQRPRRSFESSEEHHQPRPSFESNSRQSSFMSRSDSIYSNYSGSSGERKPERKPAPRSQGSLRQMQQSGLPNTVRGGSGSDLPLRRNNNNNNGGGEPTQHATQMFMQGAGSSSRSMDSTRSRESMRSKDRDSIRSRDTYDASFRSLGDASCPEHGGAGPGAANGGDGGVSSGSGYPPPPPPPRSVYDNGYYEHQVPPQRSSHYYPEMMEPPPPSRSNMNGHHYPGQPPQPYGGSRGGFAPPPPPSNEGLQIEIEPGVFAELRGAEETTHAVAVGQVVDCSCILCSLPLLCIRDAEFVLCPDCKVVSPLFHGNTGGRGGVGLGLRAEQSEMMMPPPMGGGGGRGGGRSRAPPPQQYQHNPPQNYPQDYYGGGHGGGGGRFY